MGFKPAKIHLLEPEPIIKKEEDKVPVKIPEQKPSLSDDIFNAAKWIEEQIKNNQICECGFMVTAHGGKVEKTDFTLILRK